MKDEWFRAALTDDTVVAELLFRLKQSSASTIASAALERSKPRPPSLPHLPPFSWGQRLPRSKNVIRKDSATTATRFSPTTPLSWSCGGTAAAASPSDCGYGESSVSRAPSDPSSSSRSKGACTSEATNTSSNNKRSTNKKTFTELQEEESILLKERIHLKRELASLHFTLEEQRVTSENLKRIKFDLNLQSSESGAKSANPVAMVSNRHNRRAASTPDRAQSGRSRHAIEDERGSSNSCRVQQVEETNKRDFVLPDLNMTPTEDEIAAEFCRGGR